MSKNTSFISAYEWLLAISFALLLTGPLSADEDDTKAVQAIKAHRGKFVTKVTQAGVVELGKALPDCIIVHESIGR